MDVKTTQQPTMSKEECDLVIELVEREQKELHAEIHQTDSRLPSEDIATTRSGGPAP